MFLRKNLRRAILPLLAALFVIVFEGSDCYGPIVKSYISGLEFTSQPQGGSYVQTLSCTFVVSSDATAAEPDKVPQNGDITIRIAWKTDEKTHDVETKKIPWVLNETTYTTVTTTFSAPEGYYLDKTFWVEVSWTDSGGDHIKESEKASCIVP